jgi:N-ethylmaleimide reductase
LVRQYVIGGVHGCDQVPKMGRAGLPHRCQLRTSFLRRPRRATVFNTYAKNTQKTNKTTHNMSDNILFQPIQIGSLTVQNRIFMSPMTRGRSVIPTELQAKYYKQRAFQPDGSGAGLIISEGILISPNTHGQEYGRVPGLFLEEQTEGWKQVTNAVHDANGHIFAQLWHVGRIAHPELNYNKEPNVAPSAIAAPGGNFRALDGTGYVVPHALTTEEVSQHAKQFGIAAKNAHLAGFDGVEIHGANGYLVHQFLNTASNVRTDHYGTQTFENRARFALEIIAEAVAGFGDEGRVAIKFSPGVSSAGMIVDDDTVPFYKYLLQQIGEKFPKLAYITIASDMTGKSTINVADFRDSYKGEGKVLTGTVGFDYNRSVESLEKNIVEAVVIGRAFIANSDLAYRWKHGHQLNEVNWQTVYAAGETGYTDYPTIAPTIPTTEESEH